jgi:hypothetical protein
MSGLETEFKARMKEEDIKFLRKKLEEVESEIRLKTVTRDSLIKQIATKELE